MAKRIKVPMSSARGRLFELADLVRQSSDDTAVVFEHRGSKDHVVLVREARLDYLEARVAALEKRVETPFTVRGSLKTDLPDKDLDELLRQIRQEWSSTSSKKVG
jgi:hypothetical protein